MVTEFMLMADVMICGAGVFMDTCLVNWASTNQGTAAAFGIYICLLTPPL
jgi:hypothetical protein